MGNLLIDGEYVEIDDLCIPFVSFFNRIGLKTQFCCEGHDVNESFYIIFDDSVTDEMILTFQKRNWFVLEDYCPFFKWVRIAIKNNIEFDSEEEYERINNEPFDEKYQDILMNWVFRVDAEFFTSEEEKETILNNLASKLIHGETLD